MLTKLSAILATVLTSLALADTTYFNQNSTNTPIDHVIVVVGKNVTFDTLFTNLHSAGGALVMNLLSQGIIRQDRLKEHG